MQTTETQRNGEVSATAPAGASVSPCLRGKRSAWLCAIVFLLLPFAASAQWSDTMRTILRGKMYPTAGFDSRNSFIGARRAHIWGIKAGVEFSGRLQFGLGYNMHDQNLTKVIAYESPGGPTTATAELRLRYLSLYTKFVYYKTKRWKFSVIPFQLGCGSSRYVYETDGRSYSVDKRVVVVYEAGVSSSYKPISWLGVGLDLGYRLMLRDNPAIPENFNSPIYALYASIYWAEVYKIVFPETKLAKRL